MDASAACHWSAGLDGAGADWSLFSGFTVLVKNAPAGATFTTVEAASGLARGPTK